MTDHEKARLAILNFYRKAAALGARIRDATTLTDAERKAEGLPTRAELGEEPDGTLEVKEPEQGDNGG